MYHNIHIKVDRDDKLFEFNIDIDEYIMLINELKKHIDDLFDLVLKNVNTKEVEKRTGMKFDEWVELERKQLKCEE